MVLILTHLLGLGFKMGSYHFKIKHEGKNMNYPTLRIDKMKIT